MSIDNPIFRMPQVCEQTGLKPSTIYKLIRKANFPAPIKLTARSSGWLKAEVDAWLHSCGRV
jgi:prophage regulatory protein